MGNVGVLPFGDRAAQLMSQRFAGAFATTTLLAALPADRRVHGQVAVVTAGPSLYIFDENATVGGVTPSAGSGRWLGASVSSSSGVNPVKAVKAATATTLAAYTRTANVILADANGALGTIDGVTIAVGDRILLKNGAAGADNGIWACTSGGGASAKFGFTRAPDFDESADAVPGTIVVVEQGTANADLAFMLTTNATITLNTTSLTFTVLPSYSDLTSTANGDGASLIGVEDAAGNFDATDVEAALAEIMTLLASTTATEGAALVGINDAGSYLTGTTVEAALQELGAVQVHIATKSFGFADLQEADQDIDVDFDAALPAGAVVIGGGINVTAIFDNAGDTASVTADLGIASGDRDAFCDGLSLDAVASVGSPVGASMGALVGAITPSVNVLPDVNGNTLTKGAAVAYVLYVLAF